MSKKNKEINQMELIALILMLFPVISIIGVIIYILNIGKPSGIVKLILLILTIPFGFFAAIFLWLDALGIISL